MIVIDRRGQELTTTFGDLAIGEAFQDEQDRLCIKTDLNAAMRYNDWDCVWYSDYSHEADELIIPLEVTYTIEREESGK